MRDVDAIKERMIACDWWHPQGYKKNKWKMIIKREKVSSPHILVGLQGQVKSFLWPLIVDDPWSDMIDRKTNRTKISQ